MDNRRLILISGKDAVHFLQGLLTQDMAKLPEARIQFAALLSPQGKILHDMFVVHSGAVAGLAPDDILLDTPEIYADTLIKRLMMYKLRADVKITSLPAPWQVALGAEGLPDPRHPDLSHRFYTQLAAPSLSADEYASQSLAFGIPDSIRDFAPDEVVALDAGYDLLHAVSYTKGCYVGQEVTARMHYKQIARRRFYLLEQEGKPVKLALLKHDDVARDQGLVTIDGQTYQARLPNW